MVRQSYLITTSGCRKSFCLKFHRNLATPTRLLYQFSRSFGFCIFDIIASYQFCSLQTLSVVIADTINRTSSVHPPHVYHFVGHLPDLPPQLRSSAPSRIASTGCIAGTSHYQQPHHLHTNHYHHSPFWHTTPLIPPHQYELPKHPRHKMSTILIPLYIYPSFSSSHESSGWAPLFRALTTALTKNPSLEFLVVINPGNGPGPDYPIPNADYRAALSKLSDTTQYPNVKVIGYVHCSYGQRAVEEVERDVKAYLGWLEFAERGEWVSYFLSCFLFLCFCAVLCLLFRSFFCLRLVVLSIQSGDREMLGDWVPSLNWTKSQTGRRHRDRVAITGIVDSIT